MKKSELIMGTYCIEKKPSDHTSVLQQVEVIAVRSHYSFAKKRMQSCVYYKTLQGQSYPARNHGYLDGLVGDKELNAFKKAFTIGTKPDTIRRITFKS